MIEIALKMILCLLIAALIGAIIGYILGRLSKCDGNEDKEEEVEIDAHAVHMLSLASQDMEVEKIDDEQETMHKIIDDENGITSDETNLDLGIDEDKPLFLDAPRDGKADDLKEISGIGLKIEEVLNGLGIYHFDQISNWNEENLKWIDEHLLVFKGRAKRENWVEQAKVLVAGGQTDFSKRVKNGDIKRY